MKNVTGAVVSCETVPLSKAARILSKFVSSDNAASPAFAAYLRRSSAAFEELVQLHKELKRSGSRQKDKKRHSKGVITEGVVESFQNCGKDDSLAKEIGTSKGEEIRGRDKNEQEEAGRFGVSLNVDEETTKHKSKNRRDEDEGKRHAVSMEVQKVEGVADENMGDVGRTGKKSKKKRENNDSVGDEDEGICNAGNGAVSMQVQKVDDFADGNMRDVGRTGKKSKKKREGNKIVAVTSQDQFYGDHDAVNTDGTESIDGSKEKKKKRNKPEGDIHDVAANIKKEGQSHHHIQSDGNGQAIETGKSYGDKLKKRQNDPPLGDHGVKVIQAKGEAESFDESKERKKKKIRDTPVKEKSDDPVIDPGSQADVNEEATQILENNSYEKKSRKKNKKKSAITEERVISGIKGNEQRDESKGNFGNIENVYKDDEEKKHKKQRPHEERERENESKPETDTASNKESRKRKHEGIAAGGLENSVEKHKSKKKKRSKLED